MQQFRLCTLLLLMSCGAQLGDPTTIASGSDDVPSSDAGGNGNVIAPPPDAAPTPTPLDACCHDRAHCVATTDIPAASQTFLHGDSCDDDQLCIPDQLLDKDPITTCTATTDALGAYSGVCLSDCLHFGVALLALAKGDCNSHELCVPCTVQDQPTGAPGCP